MAVITLSDLINDIRGKVGGKVYSIWKGIHTVKSQPINFRYAWESQFNAGQRALIKTCAYRWQTVLTNDQKAGWETYALYLATLPTDYDRLVGWKQYGGAMSGFNAYTHCNQLRLSVGLVTIQDDAPNAETSPGQPLFNTFIEDAGPPINLTATYTLPGILPLPSYIRAWCEGTRFAHLILAKYNDVSTGGGDLWTVEYEANELPPAATPPWALQGVERGVIEDGILHIDSAEGEVTNYIQSITYPQAGICVRTRMKSPINAGDDIWLSVRIQDSPTTGWWVWLVFRWDKVCLLVNGINVHEELVDATNYHDYQLSFNGTDWYLKVDGITVHTELSPGTIGVGLSQIEFGQCLPTPWFHSYWDWVRYYLGAPEPGALDLVSWDTMRYARGAELDIFPDVYKCQLDIVSDKGRFSPPSNIKELRVT